MERLGGPGFDMHGMALGAANRQAAVALMIADIKREGAGPCPVYQSFVFWDRRTGGTVDPLASSRI